MIDRETMGRAASAAAAQDDVRLALITACCTIVNALWMREKADRKTLGSAVSYANTDGYMETYNVSAPAAARAALQIGARDILRQCLGCDPYGLLYQGL